MGPGLSGCLHSYTSWRPCAPAPQSPVPLHPGHTLTLTHTGTHAYGRCRPGPLGGQARRQADSARAELMAQLGCLEMIQGHPCCSQRRCRLLQPDRGVEELLLYFYTFISLHFQQAGTAHLQNTLGSRKLVISIKKILP